MVVMLRSWNWPKQMMARIMCIIVLNIVTLIQKSLFDSEKIGNVHRFDKIPSMITKLIRNVNVAVH